MKAARNIVGGFDTIRELFEFLWSRKLWWLIPAVVIFLLIGLLLIAGQVTGVAPFIYTLF